MKTFSQEPVQNDLERAEHHAREAERLARSWWISSHVQGQLHATLALYYATRLTARDA